MNTQNNFSSVVFTPEYANQVNSVNAFAVEALKEALDYLGKNKVNQPTPMEKARYSTLSKVRIASETTQNLIKKTNIIEVRIKQVWTEYQEALSVRNNIMMEREVNKSRKLDISDMDIKLQDQFKVVGALLDRVNELKTERNAVNTELQSVKKALSQLKRSLDNPGDLAAAYLI